MNTQNIKILSVQYQAKPKSAQLKLKQAGVVLFFALIALVAMSLAAVALIRSVDTNNLIAGNLAFKQSSMLSADRGTEKGVAFLRGQRIMALNTSNAVAGYFATATVDAKTLVDASGIDDTADDGQGNAIRYVIQRMCNAEGNLTDTADKRRATYLFAPGEDPACKNIPNPCTTTPLPPVQSLVYRITARVTGPKNTVSYIQTFVF